MNCNGSLPTQFCIELHDDILYILDKSNDDQANTKWKHFLEKCFHFDYFFKMFKHKKMQSSFYSPSYIMFSRVIYLAK